jgi:hypothetical protein
VDDAGCIKKTPPATTPEPPWSGGGDLRGIFIAGQKGAKKKRYVRRKQRADKRRGPFCVF